MVYISLGSTCSIVYNLKRLELRTKAYPFDWIRILNLNKITELINNNFDKFLDIDNFEFKEYSDKFMIDGEYGSYIYSNDYCNFYHEFNKPINECDVDEFINKYQRRINRFMDLLNSDEEIIFVREELRKVNINKINNFINSIQNVNPNINFKLVIISNYEIDYEIDNVIFHYSDKKIDTWMRYELEWYKIFFI